MKVRPPLLTLPLAWLLVLVGKPLPVSFIRPASSQKPADRPPPRSSVPRKPRRLKLLALFVICHLLVDTGPEPVV